MTLFNVAVIVGSIKKDSINKKLVKALAPMFPSDFKVKMVDIFDLPLYNEDDELHPPAAVQRLKTDITNAQGVLFVTPEYNRSIPGCLKNAIDHASRPYGHSVWRGKPVAVLGVSPGPIGTAMAQQHLKSILSHLDMPLLGQPEGFIQAKEGLLTADGQIGTSSKEFFQGWVSAYVNWVKKHQT